MTPSDSRSFITIPPRTRWLLGIFLVSILLRTALPPLWIENLYSRGLFVAFRAGFDAILARLPFPLFYVFWIIVLLLIIRGIRKIAQDRRHLEHERRIFHIFRGGRMAFLRVFNVILVLITLFLWIWGFNYGRIPVEKSLNFSTYEPSLDELRKRVFTVGATLSELRASINADSTALDESYFEPDLEQSVRPLIAQALLKHGVPAPGRPRARQLWPEGILLRLSTAGVYWPWAGEGNIDAGLHPLQKPAVMAHELAHAYGFGEEGTCSFWAWLAGRETTDPVLRYAFTLAYWRRIAGRLRYADPKGYLAWRQQELHPGIRNDLQAIYDNGDQYRDIAPVIRDATYNAYLKAQGVHDGLLSYGRVVKLVEGYRKAYPDSIGEDQPDY